MIGACRETDGRGTQATRLFPTFALIARGSTPLVYPSPGWRVKWLEVSRNWIAFDMTGCYYLDALDQ